MTASLSVNLASAFKRADELTSLADHAGHAGIAGKMERRREDGGGNVRWPSCRHHMPQAGPNHTTRPSTLSPFIHPIATTCFTYT